MGFNSAFKGLNKCRPAPPNLDRASKERTKPNYLFGVSNDEIMKVKCLNK